MQEVQIVVLEEHISSCAIVAAGLMEVEEHRAENVERFDGA